jgi:hypothetical protein
VNLAALDERRIARVGDHCGSQRLAAVEQIEPRLIEIDAALGQFPEQLLHHNRILDRTLPHPEHDLVAEPVNTDRHDQMLALEDGPVHQHHREWNVLQGALHQFVQFAAAGLHEVFRGRALLQTVCLRKLLHHFLVAPHREAVHYLLPDCFFHQRSFLKQCVAA